MSTGHVLLGLLAGGGLHGYDLKRAHDECFPAARPLAFGQVYATLERLKKNGYVVPVQTVRVDGPDRRVYAMTDQGRAELEMWLATIDEPSPHVANPLAVRATIALLLGDEDTALAYLRKQRRAHLARMRHYTGVKSDPTSSVAVVLEADYALAHLDADIRWLETALERIAALGGTDNQGTPRES